MPSEFMRVANDSGLIDRIGAQHLTRTTGESVHTWVAESGVHWVDWEDRESGTTQEEKP